MGSSSSEIVLVFFQNINGVRNQLRAFENLLFKYDIVCLAKHLLNVDISSMLEAWLFICYLTC